MSDNINYYQSIPQLGIKGRIDTPKEFDRIGLPKKMQGWDVLDIGCNIGAYMLECLRRGAGYVDGVEPNLDWRLLAKGILDEYDEYYGVSRVHKSLADLDGDGITNRYELVLLLSVTHVPEGTTGQRLLDIAYGLTIEGGLLIVEINDRLQVEKLKLPHEAKLFGKAKDNRSVYHIIKSDK